ncbi:MAG: tetratricopeptide repeat protein, partial [Desulfobacterales bacterium]
MNTKHYKIKFDGTIANGLTKEQVKKNLTSLYNIDARKIEKIFSSSLPTILKSGVNYQSALEFKEAFKKAGAICTIYETTDRGEDIPIAGDKLKDRNKSNVFDRVSLNKTMGWGITIAILIASLSVSYYFLVYLPKIKKEAVKSITLQAEAFKKEEELKINQTEVNVKDASVYKEQGYAYTRSEKYQKAIEAFNQASRIDPNDPRTYLQRANAYHRLGNSKRAIEDYNLAIRLDPDNVNAYYNRGIVYVSLDQNDKAIEDFNHVIRLDPNNSEAYNNRSVVYYKLGEFRRAVEDSN